MLIDWSRSLTIRQCQRQDLRPMRLPCPASMSVATVAACATLIITCVGSLIVGLVSASRILTKSYGEAWQG